MFGIVVCAIVGRGAWGLKKFESRALE